MSTTATHPAAATGEELMRLKIAGMDCGSCALTIEQSIRNLPGVRDVNVSFTTESMEVDGDVSIDALESRLKELGYHIAGDEPAAVAMVPEHRGLKGFLVFLWEQPVLRVAVIVAAAVLAGLLFVPGLPPIAGIEPLNLLFGGAVIVAGAPVFMKGFRALIFARRITIDLLMAIASIGALAIGATGEAITVILLFMLGEALEAYSAERARGSLRSLLALQPLEATVLQRHDAPHDAAGHDSGTCSGDHDHGHAHESHGHEHEEHAAHDHTVVLPVDQVKVNDRVLVRPGQRIPVDGVVIEGISSVNQAPVTGESVPVIRQIGDEVMAGTVNGEAALTVEATRLAADGTIARIARLVEQAQAQRSPAERFIDRFARWYTPAVVALAVLIVLIPVFVFGQPLLTTEDGTTGWLYRGLAMLIIACPCALVISIPVTVVSGLTRLANLGVLVKGGAQLDQLASIETVAFDKTGTLTHGRPVVTTVRGLTCEHPPSDDQDCEPCDDVVSVAATVERASEHPVAHAILDAAKNRARIGHLAQAAAITAHPGKGVSGVVDGRHIVVGTADLFDGSMAGIAELRPHAEKARALGETIMYVGADNQVVGFIGVHDEIRDVTRRALSELNQLNVRTVMLTGDHEQAAARVARELDHIDDIRASLLPDGKLAEIEALNENGDTVAMVGDGINDAPALARAAIGIAMGGGGTAQAMETADVVLMQDDLSHVPMALRIARKSRQIIKQNIALSLGLKLAFLGLAIPGIATLWMAVLADVGATLLVTLNGMRLLRQS